MPLAIEVIDLLNEIQYNVVVFAHNQGLNIYKGPFPTNASQGEILRVSSVTSDGKISKEIMQHLDFRILRSRAHDYKVISFETPETSFKGAFDEDINIMEELFGYPQV